MFLNAEGVRFVERFGEMVTNPHHFSGVVTLRHSLWPEDVKAAVVEAFAQYGQERVLDVKLVEPFAIAFGGRDVNGTPDHSKTDWELLKDYFRWEAAALLTEKTGGEGAALSHALQEAALKKHGHYFNHYQVYDPL